MADVTKLEAVVRRGDRYFARYGWVKEISLEEAKELVELGQLYDVAQQPDILHRDERGKADQWLMRVRR